MELIERESFLATLRSQFKLAGKGEGHSLFVCGEAGIGKTSLVNTFCKELRNSYNILRGTCDALFAPRPLAPLFDILLQLDGDFPDDAGSIADRSAFFTGVLRRLVNRSGTIVLLFEDIHWADEATLDFIRFLARRIRQLPCLFICTYRSDEIDLRHPLRTVLGQLNAGSFTRLQLQPFSLEAIRQMSAAKEYDAGQVYSISGGNPFYVTEILASEGPGVPENVKEAVLSVYNRMDEPTREVWQLLSVIPDGLELDRLVGIDALWQDAIGRCIETKVLVVNNGRVFFKHELFRRAIEDSFSPLRRIALNKKLLSFLLNIFEQEKEYERIVHYAKNAFDYQLVAKYAPMAARQAALVGAHIEAARLYQTAIEYASGETEDSLAELYEAFAYECYLTNRMKEAILYEEKALKGWQQRALTEKAGNSLRMLSRLWWFDGRREEAERYGQQAIDVLKEQPCCKAKAMAYSNMSQLKLFSNELDACVALGNKAIEIARTIQDHETLCHALNNVGCAQWRTWASGEEGKLLLMESLHIALENSLHECAARAYSNLSHCAITSREYGPGGRFLQEGIAYCEERDLDSSNGYKLYLQSWMLMAMGDWQQASTIAGTLLDRTGMAGTVRLGALVVLGTIQLRKGEPQAWASLKEARDMALATREYQRILPAMTAILEYEWLTGKKVMTDAELNTCLSLVHAADHFFLNSDFAFWLCKARRQEVDLSVSYEPYQLMRAGNATAAAAFWDKKGCPYEKGLALLQGGEKQKLEALRLMQELGATAVCAKIKQEMRSVGMRKIPKGIRQSTRRNPAQLTNREMDILQLLKGGIQNKEIAESLFISPKTVDHHISSILFKLDVNSRSKAVMEGVRLGILP